MIDGFRPDPLLKTDDEDDRFTAGDATIDRTTTGYPVIPGADTGLPPAGTTTSPASGPRPNDET
jgi:hypothetical protein